MKYSTLVRGLSSAHRSGRTTRASVAGKLLLAGALTFGLRSAALASTDLDGTDGKDSKDKKAVVEKKADSRIKFTTFVEAGVTGNPNAPDDHQNFGRIFDDRSNEPLLNQVTLTLERALAPEPGKFDWGFKFQAGVGSDGRFVNTLGTLENVSRDIVEPYVIEAYGNLHAPLGPVASVDFKFGQFVTLLGAETIDPRTNYFYSHDYVFNFGIPLQHLGGEFTVHVNPTLDIYAGINRGVNTSVYDNNGAYPSFLGGFGLNNLVGGKLTILATTSIGPENPRESVGSFAYHGSGTVHKSDPRYYGNLVATYKITDKLTSVTDAVYTYDAGYDTDFYGAAETLAYTINDMFTVAARFEAVRDSDGFFVAQFAANDDFTNVERGGIALDPRTVSGGANDYLESTIGVQIKPIKSLNLTIRPEGRVDYATENKAFDDSSKQYSVTGAVDAIFQF